MSSYADKAEQQPDTGAIHGACQNCPRDRPRWWLVYPIPEIRNILLQIHRKKYLVFVILIDWQISFRDFDWRMIINRHNQRRRNPLLPGMISKSLPQRMAADRSLQIQVDYCLFDDPKGIGPDDRLVDADSAFEDKFARAWRWQRILKLPERLDCFLI